MKAVILRPPMGRHRAASALAAKRLAVKADDIKVGADKDGSAPVAMFLASAQISPVAPTNREVASIADLALATAEA